MNEMPDTYYGSDGVGEPLGEADIRQFRTDVHQLVDDAYYTEDGPRLQRYQTQDVFVFNDLKTDFRNHSKMGNAELLGRGFTILNGFKMFITERVGRHPVVIPWTANYEKGKVFGEVWRVPTFKVFAWDFMESNTIHTRRNLQPISVSLNRQDPPIIHRCWMYVGRTDYWMKPEVLKGLQPLPLITNPKDLAMRYYVYRKLDDQAATAVNKPH